jgi:uracil-DNA glycosylase
MIFEKLSLDWLEILQEKYSDEELINFGNKINNDYQTRHILPPLYEIFNAFNLCSIQKIKVVILGQDPYHGPNQAHGLSFSVPDFVKIPPSLRNIFKELKADIPQFEMPRSGNLEQWSKQGVLLLNAVLSVEAGKPGSHKNLGWQNYTNAFIKAISDKKEHVVFLLWGNYAIEKLNLIDEDKHLVLTAAHPSPLARGKFFGCKHFSKTNTYLLEHNIAPIDWSLN